MKIEWIDAGREPSCKPNPAYPDGIDIDLSRGASVRCQTALPYPARRCGAYVVECPVCGIRVMVTTAGRPDDPRSVKIACKTANERPT
jgi:DNA-directed RNA polymerase subunit RPC12/RpoP